VIHVEHPTQRENFYIVSLPNGRVAFSYKTVIGVYCYGEGWTVAINTWGPTTGKHLNWLDEDKATRIDQDKVEAMVPLVLGRG